MLLSWSAMRPTCDLIVGKEMDSLEHSAERNGSIYFLGVRGRIAAVPPNNYRTIIIKSHTEPLNQSSLDAPVLEVVRAMRDRKRGVN